MIKRAAFSAILFILAAASASAQSVGMPSVGGYWSTTACGTGPSPCFVQYGGAAAGSTDSGTPVKIGGVYNTTPPTYATGQRGNLELGQRGSVKMQLMDTDGAGGLAVVPASSDALNGSFNGALNTGRPYGFNGSTWDRGFTCPSSAVVNVTAAATTQIVALSASTIIRVCSFTITGSAAATAATWVYGTGANCATGQVALTGAMLMPANGSIVASGMNGSLFRGISANALCLTAATGNVTGFVTYVQY